MTGPDLSAACFTGEHAGCKFPRCQCRCHRPASRECGGGKCWRCEDESCGCPCHEPGYLADQMFNEPTGPYPTRWAFIEEQPMRLTITATDQLTHIDGVPCRYWEGVTEDGVKCKVFVHRVAVHNDYDASQFEKALKEQMPPGRTVPLSMIL